MSASSYTANYGLALIDFNSQNWHDDDHRNLQIIDGALGSPFLAAIPFGTATNSTPGTGNNFIVTLAGVTLTAGRRISFLVGASTAGFADFNLNVNGLGNRQVFVLNASTITGGVLTQGDYAEAVYDGGVWQLTKPLRALANLLIINGNSGANPIAGGINFVISTNDNTGMSLLAPANKVCSLYFGKPTTGINNAKFSKLDVDMNTGTMTLGVVFDGTNYTNTLQVKSDRVVHKLQTGVTDTDAGTDFMITPSTGGKVTMAFLGGATNGITFLRTGSVQFLAPPKMPVYTVATLPAAATYIYCRAMVSDANTATFNAIVAGGGANKITVFSDGTNWRIG